MNRYEKGIRLTSIHLSPCHFRDPVLYPDYDEFRPGRFLDKGSENISDMASPGHVTYGFGKR